MALIEKFEKDSINFKKKHETAETTYSAGLIDNEIIFQINMYGSAYRKYKGKVSQVVQLNKESAKELISLLKNAFNI